MSFEVKTNSQEVAARREIIEQEISDFRDNLAEKFADDDLEKINDALDFMLKIHLPQENRVDGKPFASHPLAVAAKVMELSDNPELIIAALVHDSVENQPDHVFVGRIHRKYPNRDFLHLDINEALKEKYKEIFKNWSFREIKEKFGDKVGYYTENMTNHDFNSLAEELHLTGEEKRDFINKLYAEHVEEIIDDPELFTLKLADLSTNIDLNSLDPGGEKYRKLKRKYKSVIEAILEKLKNLKEDQPLYGRKDELIAELQRIYVEQYADQGEK